LKNPVFILKVWLLKNTGVGLKLNFYITKMIQKFVICVEFWTHIFVLQIYTWTYFCGFYV